MPKLTDFSRSVGIDVGIRNYAYDSDGHSTPNPENIRKLLKPLKRANRKMSRRVFGSKNYTKAKRYHQIIHERIVNRRKDFQHKLSTEYARRYDLIFLEKLKINNMVKNHHLAQSVMDAAWRSFKNMLDYKMMMVEVDAYHSTQKCSRCGESVGKSLAVMIHFCHKCGMLLDRDHNSSCIIHERVAAMEPAYGSQATAGIAGSYAYGDPNGV